MWCQLVPSVLSNPTPFSSKPPSPAVHFRWKYPLSLKRLQLVGIETILLLHIHHFVIMQEHKPSCDPQDHKSWNHISVSIKKTKQNKTKQKKNEWTNVMWLLSFLAFVKLKKSECFHSSRYNLSEEFSNLFLKILVLIIRRNGFDWNHQALVSVPRRLSRSSGLPGDKLHWWRLMVSVETSFNN